MRKRIGFFPFVLLIVVAFSLRAEAQGFDFNMDTVSQYLKYLPPIIKSVRHYPQQPKPGGTVKITARIERIHFGNEDFEYIDSVTLFYSLDSGGTWEEEEMDQEGDDPVWSVEIDAPEDCRDVLYYVRALDSADNVAMEMPPELSMIDWAPESEEETIYDVLPLMFEHKDAADAEIPPYFDVLSLRFGYDDDNLYFRVGFEQPMYQGTVSPIDVNVYLLALINRALILDPKLMGSVTSGNVGENDAKEFSKYFWAWFYSPLVEIVPALPDVGKIPGVALVHLNMKNARRPLPIFETTGFKYEIKGNFLNLAIDRNMIGPSERNTVTFVAGNARAVGADIMSIKPIVGDISYSTSVIMDGHYFNVCEPAAEEEPPEEDSEK